MANLKRVSFATCNLYNLNLPGQPMYTNAQGWSEAEFQRKIDWMARALDWVDADVWAFQELWDGAALERVFDAAGKRADYDLLVPPGHDGRSIVVAGAVRRGLLEGAPQWVTAFPPELVLQSAGDDPQTPEIGIAIRGFSRPMLRFKVRPRAQAEAVEVFVLHLKSKRPTEVFREPWYLANRDFYKRHAQAIGAALSTVRRTAEAAAARMLVTEAVRGSDAPVVVMGDLNDGQHSNTQDILTGDPHYIASGDVLGGSDVALYATQALQNYRTERDVYYTYLHESAQESLDHVLVSQEFYDNSKKRVWAFDGLDVFNDHLNFGDPKKFGTSDHGIVKVTFVHKPR